MEFLQLEYFRHAARTENFSHTAKTFMVPPSSVSSTIKKLETELGVKLFDRQGNTIRLNEKGRLFLKSVDNIFSELVVAKNNMCSGEKPSGTIRVLVMTNRRLMTKIISEFNTQYPDVSFVLDLSENNSYTNYDIIITDAILDNDNFYSENFLTEEICLAVPKSNPISFRRQVAMYALKNEKFISFSVNHSLRDITNSLCRQAGFSPDIIVECDDPFYIRECVKLGMGVSIVPAYSWKSQFDDSVSLLKINDGVYRESRIYVNTQAPNSAKFFAQYIKPD